MKLGEREATLAWPDGERKERSCVGGVRREGQGETIWMRWEAMEVAAPDC